MTHSTSTTVVGAPPEFVWAYIATYANDPTWRAGVSRMHQHSAGPVHVGAEVDEVLRIMGRTVRSRVIIESVDEGRSFAWRVTDGAAFGRRWVRVLSNGATELGAEKTLVLRGADKLLAPLVGAVVRRTERADLVRAAREIERLYAR